MKDTVRVLVARMKDDAESGFAKGSIQVIDDVPVLLNFDPAQPIGRAALEIVGDEVYADITVMKDVDIAGKYPALGGRATRADTIQDGILSDFLAFEVGLADSPNADPKIPAIGHDGTSKP